MAAAWLFLSVGPGLEVALPQGAVHRLVHRDDPEFKSLLPESLDLAAALGSAPDPTLPGILVRLASGAIWRAGDATLHRSDEALRYIALSPDLFALQPPWCRGILEGGGRWAYVVDEEALRRAAP